MHLVWAGLACLVAASCTFVAIPTPVSVSVPVLVPVPVPVSFQGPSSSFAVMDGGFAATELGLVVMAGPSTVCDGLGLYLALNEDTHSVVVPAGTVVCGYSKRGSFNTDAATGDKTVGFGFHDATTGVVFEKKLQPLLEVLGECSGDAQQQQQERWRLAGHAVSGEGTDTRVGCTERLLYTPVAAAREPASAFAPAEIGVYCNDLAYHLGMTEESYLERAARLNVLELVWRLAPAAHDPGMLEPTWPVIIAAKDMFLDNSEPREAGLSYGYGYWNAQQQL